MYIILKQFIIGSDVAWVAKLDDTDPIYSYEIEQDAIDKMNELIANDTSGRKYKVVKTD
jgi:hypothetical protein